MPKKHRRTPNVQNRMNRCGLSSARMRPTECGSFLTRRRTWSKFEGHVRALAEHISPVDPDGFGDNRGVSALDFDFVHWKPGSISPRMTAYNLAMKHNAP